MLRWLREHDIEEPAGGMIEDYVDHYAEAREPMPNEAACAFERFLKSSVLGNRKAALWALVLYLKRYDYAADALLLHFQGRGYPDTEEYAGLEFLYKMADAGDESARRIAKLLSLDPYVKEMEFRA
jgi:hypothetical protein